MTKSLTATLVLLVLLVLFFAVNIIADTSLRGVRVDLTENKLYTLSDGAKNIARAIDEPISLTLYTGESLMTGNPGLQSYAKRVRELLQEFAIASRGGIKLRIVEPEPFTDEEDEAYAAGLRGIPDQASGSTIYLGLVGTNAVDGREIIPFLDPSQERFLEYEFAKMIHTLSVSEKPVVAVMSSLPLDGSPPSQFNPQPQRAWGIMREMRALFDVRMLEPGADAIEEDVDVLLVVHPKNLTDQTLYAIDQFVLGGGRLITFVDPNCEQDIPPGAAQNMQLMMQADRSSTLNRLLVGWGVSMSEGQVAGDLANAQRVQVNGERGPEAVAYLPYIGLTGETLDDADATTGRLSALFLATAGILERSESASTEFEPLITTSDESMRIDAQRVKLFPDPKGLLREFVPRGQPLVLAARVSGDVTTAFPEGKPEDTSDEAPEGEESGDTGTTHLAASTQPANIIVVSDVDMLGDTFWVREMNLGGMTLGYQKVSDNADFLINAIDNMAGSSDLISVRARGTFVRPFTRINELERAAEAQYRAEEQRLLDAQREAERRISEIQRARPDQGEFVFTPEQRAEIERYQAQLIETNKELRQVRLRLNENIEELQWKLKAANIGLVPLVVTAAAIVLGFYRGARRRIDRRAIARAVRT